MTTLLESIADQVQEGQIDQAKQSLDQAAQSAQTDADRFFYNGYSQELDHDYLSASQSYEKSVEADPDHKAAHFRFALICDQFGDEDSAIEHYEACISSLPAPTNALVNLAVLYEENGMLREAEACLKSVIDVEPNHWRARHFLKSVNSSYHMVIDEKSQHANEQRSAVLDTPVTDFELSVRSRNCLRQMNIRTLGDLLTITEAELLSYKNFGETSLVEVQAMLDQKGLQLGQALKPAIPETTMQPTIGGGSTIDLNASVSELELSVRSRKALQMLGISTVGELAHRTEAELMTVKNFGQTSLVEIKNALIAQGLSFRTL